MKQDTPWEVSQKPRNHSELNITCRKIAFAGESLLNILTRMFTTVNTTHILPFKTAGYIIISIANDGVQALYADMSLRR